MANKLPYLQFFVDDYLADERVSLCSLAAQGLWVRLLCLMHKCDRRGYLQQANGQPYSLLQTARSAGCSTDEVTHLLRELIDSGVASATEHGVLYNRRMVRDERIRQVRSEAGQKGGSTTGNLLKQNAKQNSSKHPSKSLECGNGDELPSSFPAGKRKEGGVGEKGETAGFAAFWAAFPRKENKAKARESWRRLNPDKDLQQVILVAIERYRHSEQWQRGVVPHPSTWLNQRRWEDECPAPGGEMFAGIREFMTEDDHDQE